MYKKQMYKRGKKYLKKAVKVGTAATIMLATPSLAESQAKIIRNELGMKEPKKRKYKKRPKLDAFLKKMNKKRR